MSILKGSYDSGKGRFFVRNILVVIQFFISASLIICTLVIYGQINYINNKDLGFDQDNIMVIELPGEQSRQSLEAFKLKLGQVPGVDKVSAASDIPGWGYTSNGYVPEGFNNSLMFHALFCDSEYLDLLKIPVLRGRMFDEGMSTDKDAYLVNESLARMLGWDDPIGRTISRNGEHKVIGVVKDFHFANPHQEIEPLIITLKGPHEYYYLLIRYEPGAMESVGRETEKAWKDFYPEEPLTGFGMRGYIDDVYQDEVRFGKVFLSFSILAIPVAWFFMNRWLQTFAYARAMGAGAFILSIIITLVIAWLTIAFLVAMASRTSPAEALKYE